MTLHPSQFPKRADGTRFVVALDAVWCFENIDMICDCPNEETAEMVAAALERMARDGETFILEDGKCK